MSLRGRSRGRPPRCWHARSQWGVRWIAGARWFALPRAVGWDRHVTRDVPSGALEHTVEMAHFEVTSCSSGAARPKGGACDRKEGPVGAIDTAKTRRHGLHRPVGHRPVPGSNRRSCLRSPGLTGPTHLTIWKKPRNAFSNPWGRTGRPMKWPSRTA